MGMLAGAVPVAAGVGAFRVGVGEGVPEGGGRRVGVWARAAAGADVQAAAKPAARPAHKAQSSKTGRGRIREQPSVLKKSLEISRSFSAS